MHLFWQNIYVFNAIKNVDEIKNTSEVEYKFLNINYLHTCECEVLSSTRDKCLV